MAGQQKQQMSLVGGNPTTMPAIEVPSLLKTKKENTRTIRLRLLPTKQQDKHLHKIANTCSKLWNQINYARRKMFFEKKKVNLKETYKEYYEKYKKLIGSATTQQILNKNNEAWNSFFELLKLKREGKLPPFIKKLSPPGYWKDRTLGKREEMIIVRSDRYYVEQVNNGEGYLILKDFGVKVKYAGRIKWSGRQGRLEIKYESGRWFAYIPIEVGEDPPKSNPRGYVKGIVDGIKRCEPRGGEVAFIDMGLNNLFAVVMTGGEAMLVKGGVVKSEYYWWKSEERNAQATRDLLRNSGLEVWRKFHHRYLRVLFKGGERLRHLYRTAVRFLARELYERSVRRVYLGYPFMITQNNGNEYNTNIWWFRKVTQWLYDVLKEYGIELFIVFEDNTSRECSICHVVHEGARMCRGLYVCSVSGRRMNADLNAAVNIAYRVGYVVSVKKVESFVVTHNGVKPVTPHQRGIARDPAVKPRL